MKTKTFLTITALFLIISAIGQNSTIDLTFTATDSAAYIQVDYIKVMNRTQGGDTVLYWPDTVLSIYFVGIPEISKREDAFQIFKNYPNPVTDQTTISLFVPEKDKVSMVVTDISGRIILKSNKLLDKGTHSFLFTPGEDNLYFFTAIFRDKSSSIKILQIASYSYKQISLKYLGSDDSSTQLKATKDIQSFAFNLGDELLHIGYANGLQSGILDNPGESDSYTFQFATNIACPGSPTVTYEGQVYSTIQIFSQCWLKENLNVGTMLQGNEEMTDNGVLEKYCYNNEPDSCSIYGGFYQWDEMMQYTTQLGTQGICPVNWHLPRDEEWKILEGAVDNMYGIGDPVWDQYWYRGFNASLNLKSTSGWNEEGNGTDLFGFSGIPSGSRTQWGDFVSLGVQSNWWSTRSGNPDVLQRYLRYNHDDVHSNFENRDRGYSVRCLRD